MNEEFQNSGMMFEFCLNESIIETVFEPVVLATQAVIGARREEDASTG